MACSTANYYSARHLPWLSERESDRVATHGG
jgi:hypothetical protein